MSRCSTHYRSHSLPCCKWTRISHPPEFKIFCSGKSLFENLESTRTLFVPNGPMLMSPWNCSLSVIAMCYGARCTMILKLSLLILLLLFPSLNLPKSISAFMYPLRLFSFTASYWNNSSYPNAYVPLDFSKMSAIIRTSSLSHNFDPDKFI